MYSKLIIGIDAGTSVIKAVAFDTQGRQVAVASRNNHIELGIDGAAEQDMDTTWSDTAATLRTLSEQVPDLAARTLAIALTGQGDGTWLVDAEGRPVGKAMLWLDRRSAPYIDTLRTGATAQSMAMRTGTALNPALQSSQLLWLQAQQPERLARATTAMHCKDWLYFKSTGERVTCNCEGVFTFGDYRRGVYDEEVLAWLGLSEQARLLPRLLDPGSCHAPLTVAAAAETGLNSGTPVVLAGMDVPLTLLGSGGLAYDAQGLRRVGCSILGSTGMHGWVTQEVDTIQPSAEAGYTVRIPLPELHARLMSHMAATLNIDWLLNLLTGLTQLTGVTVPGKSALLELLNKQVLTTPPAQAVFHPYIADSGERGPFVDAFARAQLSGFNTSLGLPGLARSVFEGISLAARDCYNALGPLPEEIRLSGGAARSPALRQLLATVTGRPVRVSHREESGAAGAALIAAAAIGQQTSVREGLPLWVDAYLDDVLIHPDLQQTGLYDRLFPLYREITSRTRQSWQTLAHIRAEFPFTQPTQR